VNLLNLQINKYMSTSQVILAEIAEKIQIEQNFAIRHPNYPPRELSSNTIERFKQIPLQLQRKYLITQVQNYLYEIYFSHSLMSLEKIAAAAQQPLQVKNNVFSGIDINFYQRLQESNSSNGYFDLDWQIVAETHGGELIVLKDGLHLHIDRQQHLPRDIKRADIGAIVPIYLPHNLVGRDTYIIVGNLGIPNRPKSVQLYFNFTPDAAITIAQQLTHKLNQLAIPFQLAILHDPALFYRYDTGTLWLSQAGYLEIETVLAEIYQANHPEFTADTPLFTKQLAPGLGIAEVPIVSSTFGMHRCELLATGLVMSMTQGSLLASEKLSVIRQEFTHAEVSWRQPYLNPSALDGYSIY